MNNRSIKKIGPKPVTAKGGGNHLRTRKKAAKGEGGRGRKANGVPGPCTFRSRSPKTLLIIAREAVPKRRRPALAFAKLEISFCQKASGATAPSGNSDRIGSAELASNRSNYRADGESHEEVADFRCLLLFSAPQLSQMHVPFHAASNARRIGGGGGGGGFSLPIIEELHGEMLIARPRAPIKL